MATKISTNGQTVVHEASDGVLKAPGMSRALPRVLAREQQAEWLNSPITHSM